MSAQTAEAWHNARHGRFTASAISDLLTKSKTKGETFGETAKSYIKKVVSERLIPCDIFPMVSSTATDWGSEYEAEANMAYEVRRFCDEDFFSLEYFGKNNPVFVPLKGREFAGGSPDAIEHLSDDGARLVEYKCPYNPVVHLENLMLTLDEFKSKRKEYYAQMQFNMLCADVKSGVFVSYDPRQKSERLKLAILEVPYDEDFVNELLARLDEAEELAQQMVKDLEMKSI